MIKDLIKDIAYDAISLSQGLTRAKLIAAKIKNDTFRQWLNKELEGYGFNDSMLPSHRNIKCVLYLKVEYPLGRLENIPYILNEKERGKDKDFTDFIENHRVTEPISIIEKNIVSLTGQKGQIPMSADFTDLIGAQFEDQVNYYGGVIRSSHKEVMKTQYQAIVELTKQKLIDTLLSLNEEFPNLTNEFNMSQDNADKVQNIITTNIYGNNNPLNIASGNTVTQSNALTFTTENYQTLEKLGVDKKDADELKTIVETKNVERSTVKTKISKWLGSVSASIAAKGLYDNIPKLIEYVNNHF